MVEQQTRDVTCMHTFVPPFLLHLSMCAVHALTSTFCLLFFSSGGKSGSVTTCRKCKGSGIQTMYRQIGPGMVQQMQSQCDDCGGSGDFIREKDRCKKCKGKRLVERDHKLEVGTVCTNEPG